MNIFLVRPRPPRWHRIVWLSLLVPLLLGAIGALCITYRIYAGNWVVAEDRFPIMTAPHAPRRLLVFAPHCDDETLGAAGLMRQARRQGCDVRVVVITNGDGFRTSAAREFHELAVPPRDYVRYAYERQGETRAALSRDGLDPATAVFLGYPDQGLMPMWLTHWSPEEPFTSPFTRSDHGPYSDAPTPGAPYCGASLLADIKRQMQTDQPTDVFVTHPNDDHPDHAAASLFVQTALEQLRAQGSAWARQARLHCYLVHHGDWPVPQGLHEQDALAPPASLTAGDTRWAQLPLSRSDTEAKYAAIKRYRTQTEMTGRFLYSFARRNELFGEHDGVTTTRLVRVPDAIPQSNGPLWEGIPPVAVDTADPNVAKLLDPSAHITAVYACRDARHLYLRLDARAPTSSGIAYTLILRPVVPGRVMGAAVTVTLAPEGVQETATIPLRRADLDSAPPGTLLFLCAETSLHGVLIDSTGFRGVTCAMNGARRATPTGAVKERSPGIGVRRPPPLDE